MSKHTPGPWHKEAYDGDDCVDVFDARGYRVAECSFAASHEGNPRKDHERSGEEIQANARLIAAAPELLEALTLCLIEHERINDQFEQVSDTPGMALARAALAKARGQA